MHKQKDILEEKPGVITSNRKRESATENKINRESQEDRDTWRGM